MRVTPATGVGLNSDRKVVVEPYSGTTTPVASDAIQISTAGSQPTSLGDDQIGFAPSTITALVPLEYHVCSQSIASPSRPKSAEPPSPIPTMRFPESRIAAIEASAPGHAQPLRGSG